MQFHPLEESKFYRTKPNPADDASLAKERICPLNPACSSKKNGVFFSASQGFPCSEVVPTGSDSCIGEGQFHDQLEVVLAGWSRFGLGSVCQAIGLFSFHTLISVECAIV